MTCLFLLRNNKGKTLSDRNILDIIDSLHIDNKFEYICFSQFNEPLLDNRIYDFIKYAKNRKLPVLIITNGLQFDSKDVILVCKRQAGWKKAEKFSELTGIRTFTKKYPAGVLTNTSLPSFFENELTIVTDSWLDKNALNDTINVGKKVLMICDTNNFSKGADKVIIGNNKNTRSLGVMFYILSRGYLKSRGLSTDNIPDLEWWMSEEYEEPKEAKKMSY